MESLKKVRTAVIGCGMISNIYIRNLKRMFAIIDLVAVCDRNPENAKRQAEAYGVPRVMTQEEIAADESIELVVNLTPAFVHYDVIKAMLLAGKHVWTEKVMTNTLEQGRELMRLAEEKGLYLGVAPDTVLGAGVQTAKAIIDSGMIGDITSCVVSINRNQSLNAETFRFLRGEGGALPHDVGIYYIAAMTALLGPVSEVQAFGAPAPVHEAQIFSANPVGESWQIPGNNLLVGSLKFASGALAMVHFNGNTIGAEKSVFTVYGTRGILSLGDPNTFNGYVRLSLPEAEEVELPMTHGFDGTPPTDQPDWVDLAYGHRGIGVAEMAWAIRQGRPNRCSKEFGFHALEILLGLDASVTTGQRVPMTSTFEMRALPAGYYSTNGGSALRGDAERSLMA